MKKLAWFVGIVVVGIVVGLSMVGCFPIEEDDGTGDTGSGGGGGGGGINPTVTIKNNTGYSFWGYLDGGVWIKPSTDAQSWGSNLAGLNYDFPDGASKVFTLSQPLSTQSIYDFRFEAGGFSFIKYGVTVSKGMTITFTVNDVNDGSDQPSITIQNRSGKTFNSVHIKPSVVSDFGSSFGYVSNNEDLSITVHIPPSNYTVFDIQMSSTNPTNTYTRNNVTITNGMTLLFTSADADNPTIELPVVVIKNNTGYSFWGYLYGGIWIEPATESQRWENNLAGLNYDFPDGVLRAFTLSQPLSTQSIYSFRIDAGGFSFIKYNVTVTDGMVLTFTTADLER